jgi:hypothetical protein
MATIIEFRSRSHLQERLATSGTRSESADVVFFPGVRYEREEPVQESAPRTRGRRSRQRDRLDLDD